MFKSVVFFIVLVFSSSYADWSSTVVYPSNGNTGCQVCGGTYNNAYESGLTQTFTDPSPAGSAISQLTFSFNGVSCTTDYYVYLNGALISHLSGQNNNACGCGTCYTFPLITISVPSSYVRQGSNSLFFTAPTDWVDLHSVTITAVGASAPVSVCGNGIVESGESCDGGACCSSTCTFSSGTVCRASAGACDVAETCSGSSSSCPADSFASSSTVCRASAGVCDVAETCSGSAASCPADSFVSSSTVCRASAGDCDVAESCSGSSASCPADSFAPSSQVCRGSAGVCDVAESCTGSSASCPADSVAPSSQTCRASAGVCDVAESCDGVDVSCPSDSFKSSSTVCRPKANSCDVAENCPGNGASCPADVVSMTASCFCGRQGSVAKAEPDYFCTSNSTTFYQCLYGDFQSQSSLMRCGKGTQCGCAAGVECSCGGLSSPCVLTGQVQTC